jgi:phage tail sheath protein FI
MPSTLTYPGVYIEEIPSGVRTITGVATSIAAFVGWAAKGPTDRAGLVLSFSDFERQYGGLNKRSLLGYGVYHFFANGGQQAYIVRLKYSDAVAATVTLNSKLALTARNEGLWANSYGIVIKNWTDSTNPIDTNRFRLAVVQVKGTLETPVEVFENLAMNSADPRNVETVINNESQNINAAIVGGATTPPSDTGTPSPLLSAGTPGADGTVLQPNTANFVGALNPSTKDSGIYFLDRIDLFNLLCVPGETGAAPDSLATIATLETFCRGHRAILIADCNQSDTFTTLTPGPGATITGDDSINAAFYFPWVNAPDPLQENRPNPFPPCGFVAGLYAKTDSNRGVWKAPAGTEASLSGVMGVTATLTDLENGVLNPQAINCIRTFPVYGTVIWGARTLQGNDQRGSEWKYVPVRRTALFLEESLYRGLKWVVFEPNDEPLWAQIRLNVGAFMHSLFRQGAFQGTTPTQAYFVKCDKTTTTQDDINKGIVNIVVGFAPLKPAEFVVIKIQQIAGQIET